MQQLPPDSGKMTEKYQRTFSNKLVLKLKNATTAPRWRFLNCINRLHLHTVLSTKGKVVYKKLEYSIFNKKFLPTISNLPTVGSAVGWCIQRLGGALNGGRPACKGTTWRKLPPTVEYIILPATSCNTKD